MEELEFFFKFLNDHFTNDFQKIKQSYYLKDIKDAYEHIYVYHNEKKFFLVETMLVCDSESGTKYDLQLYLAENEEIQLEILYDFSTRKELEKKEKYFYEDLLYIYIERFSKFYKGFLKYLFYEGSLSLLTHRNDIINRINERKNDFNNSDFYIKSHLEMKIPFTYICLEILIRQIDKIKSKKDVISNLDKEIFNYTQLHKDLFSEYIYNNEIIIEQEKKIHNHHSSTLKKYRSYYDYYLLLDSNCKDKIEATANHFGTSEKSITRALKNCKK